MRECVAFGPVGLTAVFGVTSIGKVAYVSQGIVTGVTGGFISGLHEGGQRTAGATDNGGLADWIRGHAHRWQKTSVLMVQLILPGRAEYITPDAAGFCSNPAKKYGSAGPRAGSGRDDPTCK